MPLCWVQRHKIGHRCKDLPWLPTTLKPPASIVLASLMLQHHCWLVKIRWGDIWRSPFGTCPPGHCHSILGVLVGAHPMNAWSDWDLGSLELPFSLNHSWVIFLVWWSILSCWIWDSYSHERMRLVSNSVQMTAMCQVTPTQMPGPKISQQNSVL